MVFQQKRLGKSYFIVKMTAPAWSGRPVPTFGKHSKIGERVCLNMLVMSCLAVDS